MEPAAITQFCAYLHTRNYSPHTIENYGRDLRLFFAPLDKAPSAVSWRDIEAFIQQQRQAQLAAATINRRLNALKHFFEYLVMEHQTLREQSGQTESFPAPGPPAAQAAGAGPGPYPVRPDHAPMDHALELLMLRCGLRVSEVARLRLEDH